MIVDNRQSTLDRLDPEQRERLASLPRSERMAALAEMLGEPEEKVLEKLSAESGLPIQETEQFDPGAIGELPARLLHEYQCIPVRASQNGKLALTTLWPPEPAMDEWIYAVSGREVRWSLASAEKVTDYLTQHLGVGFNSLDDAALDEIDDKQAEAEEEEDETATIVRFVNDIVSQAVRDGATDIHVEPQEEELRIRYRVDGMLISVPVPENLRRFQDAIIARVKIMSRLNISERRLPQDGRINFRVGENVLDIRVSTVPTMYGESVSLRLLNKKSLPFTMEEIGLLPRDQKMIDRVLVMPHGIILVTGPTGSGKSTSLNAFIRQINSPEKRIITIEDPVEYEVPGVNQMQVRPEIGLEFADALRHVLRQDPDVIMVGEIRDRDTADIAIRASLTGHLVFSTLHTNDAPGALTRLIDMGIEPFLVASAVEMVIAQRLIRRLCKACRRMQKVDPTELKGQLSLLKVDLNEAEGVEELAHSPGCQRCRNSGFKGRLGIFEVLRVSENLHELIVTGESARAIRKRAMEDGMRDLALCGWEQVKLKNTTMEEVLRVTSAD